MRIAITTPQGYRDPATLRAHDLANRLVLAGHEVLFLLAGPVSGTSELQQEPRYLLREARFQGDRLEDAVGRLVDTFAPEIIHVWTPRRFAARVGLEVWDRSHAPLVIHYEEDEELVLSALSRGIELRDGELPRYRSSRPEPTGEGRGGTPTAEPEAEADPGAWPWIDARFSPLAEGVAAGRTASTPAFSRWLCRRFPEPVRTWYPSVDHQRFASRNADPDLARSLALEGRTVLVHAPSTAGFDDLSDYLEALPPVVADHPEVVLLHLGEVRTETSLVSELGLEGHVHFAGPVSPAARPAHLALADLFLGPTGVTRYDAHRLPAEVPECMAVGRPLLISDVGVADELEDGQEAVKTAGNRAGEIEAGLRRALELRPSWPAMGRRLADRSRELFDGRLNTAGLVSFYEELARRDDADRPPDPAGIVPDPSLGEPMTHREPLDSFWAGLGFDDDMSPLARHAQDLEAEIGALRAHAERLERKVELFKRIPFAVRLWRFLAGLRDAP